MAEEIRVEVDEQAVRELFSDWHGPVGQAVGEVVQIVEDTARALAPVSPIGSEFAPRGFLKEHTQQSAEHHFDDEGQVLGLIGAPRFPFNFVANPTSRKGFTYNARSAKHPGRFTVRKAADNYLEDAVDTAPHIVIGEAP